MQLEWNEYKTQQNKRKHGVSFQEALTGFYDPRQVAFDDADHGEEEEREILLGHSRQGRLLVVCYTLRDDLIIRLISARLATRKEAQDYAKRI